MGTMMVPASAGEALGMLRSGLGFLAGADPAQLPAEAVAECLRGLERAGAVAAAARGRFLAGFDAADGHLADGQRTARSWLVHCLRVTRGQAGEHQAVAALAREHAPLLDGLREGDVVTKSVALQLARWTRAIPGGVPRAGRGDLGRGGAGGGGPAGAGGDLRGDPAPHRPAGP